MENDAPYRHPGSESIIARHDQPLRGWRWWKLATHGNRANLQSVTQDGSIWPARRPMPACCVRHNLALSLPEGRTAPSPKCQCGIYAFNSPFLGLLENPKIWGYSVFGEVALWGTVQAHRMGYRAEFAYPVRLMAVTSFDSAPIDRPLAYNDVYPRPRDPGWISYSLNQTYGCEVVHFSPGHRYVEEMWARGGMRP